MSSAGPETFNGRETAGHLALELMHEIKNPLDALGNLAHLISQEPDNPEQVRRYAQLAQEQVATLARIVSQTLSFAKNSAVFQKGDLVQLAEAAIRIHQRTINAKNIHLVKKIPDELTAEMRPGEILQVLSNLIVNALDALPDHGTLHLRLRQEQGQVQIVIADNGHGIPAENCDGIFEPYFTTKEQHGTGLGLSISKKIIEHHGGKIGMRSSTRAGRNGTMFKISIPPSRERA
jgi:signal transduction histidine kinase